MQQRIGLASLVVALVLVLVAVRSVVETSQMIRHTQHEHLHNQLQAISINIRESLNLADYTAKQARKEWLAHGQLKPHREYTVDFPHFNGLMTQVTVIDSHGILVASSRKNPVEPIYLGDRLHFKVHLGRMTDEVYISEPVIGRVFNVRSVQLTRPIRDEGGQFLGVIAVTLNPDYIETTLLRQKTEPDLQVVLMGADQRVRLGNPPADLLAEMQSHDDRGILTQANAVENTDWQGQYHWGSMNLERFDVMLNVGMPRSAVDEPIKSSIWMIATVLLLILLILFYCTWKMLALVQDRNTILQKLAESKVKSSSANAMKSRFVASISHELRTPLNGIVGFSELIGMSDDFEEAKRYGSIVHKSATHLHQLVNTLLDLAKIEAGQMEITRTDSDVREICQTIGNIHRYSIEKKGLMLDLGFSPGLPTTICTDRIKLMQILNNLIHNAGKFTDSGAIFFTVGMEHAHWTFTVTDTGVGMSAEQLKNVYSRFNNIKLSHEDTAERPGAGLGMALCKDLVELLDGTINIVSEPNVGTVVTVSLPYTDEPR